MLKPRHGIARGALAVTCALAMGLGLVACGTVNGKAADATEVSSSSQKKESKDTSSDTMKVTIPKYFFNGSTYSNKTTKQIKKQLESTIGSKATKNKDGSWTVTMTKKQYKSFTSKLRKSVKATMDAMASSKSFPNIQKVEYSKNFSTATITLKTDKLEMADMYDAIAVGLPACAYQQVAGKTVKCTVTVVNKDGKKLDTTVVPDDVSKSKTKSKTDTVTSLLNSLSADGITIDSQNLPNIDFSNVSSTDIENARQTASDALSQVVSSLSQ